MAGEILQPKVIVIPVVSTTARDNMASETGTLIYDSTVGSLSISTAANTGSWAYIGIN